MEAGLALVEEKGVDGFTLREVARRAGVSHNAPYHHFPDRAAMVAAIAEQSYVLLGDAMARSARRATSPERQLRAIGLAYLRFAVSNPARFKLMNRPELRRRREVTSVEAAGTRSEEPLHRAITAGQAAGTLAGGDAQAIALTAWSMIHGLATLVVDGPLRHRVRSKREAERMANGVIDTLLAGLSTRQEASVRR